MLKAQKKFEAHLPYGPEQQQEEEDDATDALAVFNTPTEQLYELTLRRIESELDRINGVDPEAKAKHPSRCDGPQLVWHTLCGEVASEGNRTTSISRCWRRTANWLAKFAAAKTEEQADPERWKIRLYAHDFPPFPNLSTYREVVAFKVWREWLTPAVLRRKVWVKCFA